MGGSGRGGGGGKGGGAPGSLKAAGFGASGIKAASWGAGLMSNYGGAVPKGSPCAVLQSAGATKAAGASAAPTKK